MILAAEATLGICRFPMVQQFHLFYVPHHNTILNRFPVVNFLAKAADNQLLAGSVWEDAYKEMADDETREAEALEWAERTAGDVTNQTR